MRYRAPAWQTLAFTAIVAVIASATWAFSRPVELRFDGHTVNSDVPPIATRAKVFVPMRALSDAMGADTTLDEKTHEVTVTRGDRAFRVKIGSTHAKLNGMPVTLHEVPFRVRGRVMIGMRQFAEAFGMRANYDAHERRIDINSNGIVAIDRGE